MPPEIKILQGTDVDVLSPFPAALLPQAVQWLHIHPSLTMADNSPRSAEGLLELLEAAVATQPTFGIVDKNNLTRTKATDLPVVGLVTVQLLPPWSAYVHIASNRKAWGERVAKPGLLEQGARLVLEELFSNPDLLRVNAAPMDHNAAAKGLCRRLGFKQDGLFEDAVLIQGKPRSLAHFGLSRRAWTASQENN